MMQRKMTRWPWEGIYGIKNSYRREEGQDHYNEKLAVWEIRVLLLWIIWVLGFQVVKSKTRLWRKREKKKRQRRGERGAGLTRGKLRDVQIERRVIEIISKRCLLLLN
jgi:hypothetical protein